MNGVFCLYLTPRVIVTIKQKKKCSWADSLRVLFNYDFFKRIIGLPLT